MAQNDLTIYERRAAEWWDERSRAFRSLRSVNATRAAILGEWLADDGDAERALAIDLGCGGGLLAASLVDLGARVVGVDLAVAALVQAKEHVRGAFACGDARRAPLASDVADLVLLADVLEHLTDPGAALREAARLLRPGGLCYVSTISRTRRARWLAVWLAEGVGLVPRGTHDPGLFVAPEELERLASRAGLVCVRWKGEELDLARTVRHWAIRLRPGDDLSMAYSALLRKPVSA